MTATEFAFTVLELPAEQQDAFFANLKETLTEEEYNATFKFINFLKLYNNPAKYNALKNAVLDMLCEEFYGHPHEEPANKGFDPCNPVYMTSIV